jgi:hypothetical protein
MRGLFSSLSSHTTMRIIPPYRQFLFVGPNVCRDFLQILPGDGHLCFWLNASYCKVHSGLSPLAITICLGAQRGCYKK